METALPGGAGEVLSSCSFLPVWRSEECGREFWAWHTSQLFLFISKIWACSRLADSCGSLLRPDLGGTDCQGAFLWITGRLLFKGVPGSYLRSVSEFRYSCYHTPCTSRFASSHLHTKKSKRQRVRSGSKGQLLRIYHCNRGTFQ